MARALPHFRETGWRPWRRDGRHSLLARRLESPRSHIDFDIVGAGRLLPGDLILCVPGDIVPVAGTLIDGSPRIDPPGRSPGPEHAPRPGETICAGAVVQSGWLVLEVEEGDRSACA